VDTSIVDFLEDLVALLAVLLKHIIPLKPLLFLKHRLQVLICLFIKRIEQHVFHCASSHKINCLAELIRFSFLHRRWRFSE
jgi:hypothetical protein